MATVSLRVEPYHDEGIVKSLVSYDHFNTNHLEKTKNVAAKSNYADDFSKYYAEAFSKYHAEALSKLENFHQLHVPSKQWSAPPYLQDWLVRERIKPQVAKLAYVRPRCFSVPESVTSFLQESSLPEQTLGMLDSLAKEIDGFLNQMHLNHSFRLSLFIDPEDTDWRQLRFTVMAGMGLQSLYRDVRPRVYEMARGMLDGIADKVMITFESSGSA